MGEDIRIRFRFSARIVREYPIFSFKFCNFWLLAVALLGLPRNCRSRICRDDLRSALSLYISRRVLLRNYIVSTIGTFSQIVFTIDNTSHNAVTRTRFSQNLDRFLSRTPQIDTDRDKTTSSAWKLEDQYVIDEELSSFECEIDA